MKRLCLLLLAFIFMAQAKLYQVFSLIRHGARYHQRSIWDSNQTKPKWSQITAVGMRQNYELGKLLREEYIDNLGFLSRNYEPGEIEAYTSFMNRTAMSMTSQFYGLYPPKTGPKLPRANKQWHIPPYSNRTDIDEEFALPLGHQAIPYRQSSTILLRNCPNYLPYFQQNQERLKEDIERMKSEYLPFMERVSKLFNFTLKTKTLEQMFFAYEDCIINNHLGRPWPQGFTSEDFKNLKHLANWHYTVMWSGNNTIMRTSGDFSRMVELFDRRVEEPSNKGVKWSFLVGHEGDMMALQLALNITSSKCIEEVYRTGKTAAYSCETQGLDFTSTIFIELHSDDGESFHVRVRSNGNYIKFMGRNQSEIQYKEFRQYASGLIAENLTEFCGTDKQNPYENKDIKPYDLLVQSKGLKDEKTEAPKSSSLKSLSDQNFDFSVGNNKTVVMFVDKNNVSHIEIREERVDENYSIKDWISFSDLQNLNAEIKITGVLIEDLKGGSQQQLLGEQFGARFSLSTPFISFPSEILSSWAEKSKKSQCEIDAMTTYLVCNNFLEENENQEIAIIFGEVRMSLNLSDLILERKGPQVILNIKKAKQGRSSILGYPIFKKYLILFDNTRQRIGISTQSSAFIKIENVVSIDDIVIKFAFLFCFLMIALPAVKASLKTFVAKQKKQEKVESELPYDACQAQENHELNRE